jgi:hypothetical protein
MASIAEEYNRNDSLIGVLYNCIYGDLKIKGIVDTRSDQ